MKARPILFSGAMIRALLDGRKTQTRRIVKGDKPGQPLDWLNAGFEPSFVASPENALCPYGAPGDLLWAREAWTQVPASAYRMSEGVQQTLNPSDPDMAAIYAAGWERSIPKWRPSIHMPRWASRLTLEITEVRVERLQDISADDADAEGFGGDFPGNVMPDVFPAREGGWGHLSMPECYGVLWEHINGPGSWDANPWVWAVTFSVHHQNVDAFLKTREAA